MGGPAGPVPRLRRGRVHRTPTGVDPVRSASSPALARSLRNEDECLVVVDTPLRWDEQGGIQGQWPLRVAVPNNNHNPCGTVTAPRIDLELRRPAARDGVCPEHAAARHLRATTEGGPEVLACPREQRRPRWAAAPSTAQRWGGGGPTQEDSPVKPARRRGHRQGSRPHAPAGPTSPRPETEEPGRGGGA